MVSVTVIAMALLGGGDDVRGPIVGVLVLALLSELPWCRRRRCTRSETVANDATPFRATIAGETKVLAGLTKVRQIGIG